MKNRVQSPSHSGRSWKILVPVLAWIGMMLWSHNQAQAAPLPAPKTASFGVFDQRAKAGERLNVVFFGASLTWGANASNPIETSYRARVARRFEATYPRAHFRFFDAAIGGTGSQLGAFRLERDVLRHRPDLVFVDFSANDDIYKDDAETLASYESLLHRLLEANVPTVQVIFPFRWNVEKGASELVKMKRRSAHIALSLAYNTGLGDAIERAIAEVGGGRTTPDALWPIDGVHPGDQGYELFAAAAFAGFQKAVQQKRVCRVPAKMVFAPTYLRPTRFRLSRLELLPLGWRRGRPQRVSAYFDFLMSRWLDDVVIASNRNPDKSATATETPTPIAPQRIRVRFRGSMALLLGEATLQSGRYRAYIDGQLVTRESGGKMQSEFDPGAFARAINGNGHHVQILAEGLNPRQEHLLEIEPIFDPAQEQELRLESLCVAGDATASASPVSLATP